MKPAVRSALLRAAISFGLLALLFTLVVDPREVWANLRQALARRPRELALAFMLYTVLGTLIRARRWQALVTGLGHPFSLWRATELFLVGTFFNQFLPTGIGGDVVRALAVAREGLGKARAISSVLVDRALGLLPMLAIGLVALPGAWSQVDPSVRLPMILIGSAGLVGLLALGRIDRWADWLDRIPLVRGVAARPAMARFIGSFIEYDRRALRTALFWGSTFSVLLIGANAALGRAVGIDDPGLLDWAIVVPLVGMSSILPSIGGWGVREALYASLLSGQPEAAVTLSVLFGIFNLFSAVAGGLLMGLGESVGLPRMERLWAEGPGDESMDGVGELGVGDEAI